MGSHSLRARFRKHGTKPCKQKLSGAIFVGGDVAKSVKKTPQNRSKWKYVIYWRKQRVMPPQRSSLPTRFREEPFCDSRIGG
jgi:hypothetical protein